MALRVAQSTGAVRLMSTRWRYQCTERLDRVALLDQLAPPLSELGRTVAQEADERLGKRSRTVSEHTALSVTNRQTGRGARRGEHRQSVRERLQQLQGSTAALKQRNDRTSCLGIGSSEILHEAQALHARVGRRRSRHART